MTHPSPTSATHTLDQDAERWTITATVAIAFTYIFLANAWLGDDAYITFRVVWNFLNGYGPVFNPGERVQAFTHPLWMGVIAAAHAVTREFFFTVLAVSYAFSLATVLLVARSVRHAVVCALLLLSSKAFVDYTSSGLENPLSYFLLALFFLPFCTRPHDTLTGRDMTRFGAIAALAFVNRMDSIVLYALPLTYLALRGWRRPTERLRPLLVAFAIPTVTWLAAATWYYGFPLPNTYYAKVATGIPSSLLYRQGLAYLFNSAAHDPITLATIALAVAIAVRAATHLRIAAASSVLYVAYTVSVGGDFMSGRFFAVPFLVAAIVVLVEWQAVVLYRPAIAALITYNLVMPIVPVKTTAKYEAAWAWRTQNGIKDERGHYHHATNVLFYSPFRQLPDFTWVREGTSFREGPEKVTVQGSIGMFGLYAGPDKHLVDRNALSDPLLARLPVSPGLYFEFYAGHYFRDIPDGYLATISSGDNKLTDPLLHAYYDRLREVLTGPLTSVQRLSAIWALNLGSQRGIAAKFEAQRPINLSIRAANERFLTDVGERDVEHGWLRSTGRPGYLQLGPAMPARKGVYRARWIGSAEGPSTGRVGFVDVWAQGARIARHDVMMDESVAERRQIAEVNFVLDAGVTDLEYRLWVDGTRIVTLERVELFSAPISGAETR